MKSKIFFALALLIGFPCLMYFLSLTMEKRYTAQVRLEVDAMGARTEYPNPFAPIDDMTTRAKPGTVSSQVQVITGTEVLGAAIQKARENLPNKLASDQSASSAYENLVRRLQIDSDPLSDVIGLRVTQSDPELAAEIANDIAAAYQEYVEKNSKMFSQSTLTALNTQVTAMQNKLSALDTKIASLKEKAKVADATAATQMITQTKAQNDQQIATTESQYYGAVAELAEAKKLLATIPKTIVGSSSTQANPVVLGLETDLTRLRAQLADLQTKYTDDFPDVKSMKRQIRQGETSLVRYKQMIDAGKSVQMNPTYQTQYSAVVQMQAHVDNLRETLSSLKSSSSAAQEQISSLPNLQRQIDGLVRERTAMEQSYGQLQQRRDVTQAGTEVHQMSVKVVSPALVPETPSFPDPRLFTLIGLAVGGFCTILILMPRQDPGSRDYLPASYAATPASPTPGEVPAARQAPVTANASDVASLDPGLQNPGPRNDT